MATLNDLLTPRAGDPDLPALREFLKHEMTDARAAAMREAASRAAWETLPEDDGQRVTELERSEKTMAALLAKYNDLERRFKGLPADAPAKKLGTVK